MRVCYRKVVLVQKGFQVNVIRTLAFYWNSALKDFTHIPRIFLEAGILYFADGTVHNLNDYFDISATDVVKEAGYDMINAVFTEKFGVVIGENQLEDFFSQIP